MTTARSGPLTGVLVVELAGIGPAPFAARLLADLGADVIRIERPSRSGGSAYERDRGAADPTRYHLHRGRRSLALDLSRPEGLDIALSLIDWADVLIEGLRPGVAEKRGFGPDTVLARNPRLVYGRMTGWGQDGPVARTAGHDLTYLAITGALHGLAPAGGAPITPPPLLGDMGGGGVFLAFGVVAALVEAARSGRGQVVDAAVVDGVSALTSMVRSMIAQGRWRDRSGTNFADASSPWYGVYATSDGGHVAIAALEEPFWQAFLQALGPEAATLPSRDDPANHPLLHERLAALFASRTRQEWAELFLYTDVCVAPVLSLDEACDHPQLAARNTLHAGTGGVQPAPAPRFDRTPTTLPSAPPHPGQHSDAILKWLGLDASQRADLRKSGVVG